MRKNKLGSWDTDHLKTVKKSMTRNDESLRVLRHTIRTNILYNTGVMEGEGREEGVATLFKEVISKSFLNPGRDLDIQFMELIGNLKISIQNDLL